MLLMHIGTCHLSAQSMQRACPQSQALSDYGCARCTCKKEEQEQQVNDRNHYIIAVPSFKAGPPSPLT